MLAEAVYTMGNENASLWQVIMVAGLNVLGGAVLLFAMVGPGLAVFKRKGKR